MQRDTAAVASMHSKALHIQSRRNADRVTGSLIIAIGALPGYPQNKRDTVTIVIYTQYMNKETKLDKAKKLIGTIQVFTMNRLSFPVKITEVREFVGRIQYRIVPVKGTGADWVEKFTKSNKPLK